MAADDNLQTHRATYERLIWLLKYGAVGCLAVALVVIYLISRR